MESNTTSPPDLVPPTEPRTVFRLGLFAIACTGLAALLGLLGAALDANGPGPLSTIRLLLVALGGLLAGSALSLRANLWEVWGLAAGTCLLAALGGLPEHWDSARLLARVFTGLTVAGTILAALPAIPRYALLSCAVLFHFGGILTATTWPDPAPWLTTQLATRVYMPYLTLIYMRNAYHFYSPEPGPASLIYVLVRYELDETDPRTGKPKETAGWAILPRRDEHMKDPLGLTYYRRLSLTEGISRVMPDLLSPETFEKLDARNARAQVAVTGFPRAIEGGSTEMVQIPIAPPEFESPLAQYRVPQPDVSRYLLPSYAKHLAEEYTAPGRKVLSVKIYRLEHRILQPPAFIGVPPYNVPRDLYTPTSYRPYFLGEYDPEGRLINPKDPMLYWLVPILPKANDPTGREYEDYLSKHAGYQVDWRRP
jgi:hypothetical protein